MENCSGGLAGTGDDTGSVVELGDSGSSSPWVET